MSRSYRGKRAKSHFVYSTEEVMTNYSACRNTVSNWVKSGLAPSDESKPYVFRGAELNRFHRERRARTKAQLRCGEFKCTGCKSAVFPEPAGINIHQPRCGGWFGSATCPDCGAHVRKFLNATECDKIKKCAITNTTVDCTDECKCAAPARIGSKPPQNPEHWYMVNDRIIQDWLLFAGRWNVKTVDAHLSAIRDFEAVLEGKDFVDLSNKDVDAYRQILLEKAKKKSAEGGLSRSTIAHRVSHVRSFLKWLIKQDGYRRLNKTLPDYLDLPRNMSAKADAKTPKQYATLDEAERMVKAMPLHSLKDRRDRAVVALAFVSGFRAGALSALRMQHVDTEKGRTIQDADEVPAKNGKSYTANWFPRTERFREIVVGWMDELQALGLGEGDAVFPGERDLNRLKMKLCPPGDAIAPMNGIKWVQQAFSEASAKIEKHFTPHSARHTLAALGRELCRTVEQRKAWSLNLGHETEEITEKHYGHMTHDEQQEIMSNIDRETPFTQDEAALMLDYHEHKLVLGTPEFEQAERLVAERKAGKDKKNA